MFHHSTYTKSKHWSCACPKIRSLLYFLNYRHRFLKIRHNSITTWICYRYECINYQNDQYAAYTHISDRWYLGNWGYTLMMFWQSSFCRTVGRVLCRNSLCLLEEGQSKPVGIKLLRLEICIWLNLIKTEIIRLQ